MGNDRQARLDWVLIAAVACQVVLGIFLIYSASSAPGERIYADSLSFFRRHLWVLAVSLVVAVALFWHWRSYLVKRYAKHLLGLAIALVLLTLVPGVGAKINGASRWLQIGPLIVYMQPVVILFIAVYSSKLFADNFGSNRLCSRPSLLLFSTIVVFALLNSLQPDVTSTVLLVTVFLFCGCIARWYKFVGITFLTVACFVLFSVMTMPYRWARIAELYEPFNHRFDSGYQMVLSLSSIGGGGVWGVGYGDGLIKNYLPDVQGSFIYSALVEELGAVGGLTALALAAVICWRCFAIAGRLIKHQKHFEGMLVYFLSFWMTLLSIFHVACVLGLLPVFNVPFPFLSYGGSYFLVFMVVVALALKFDYQLKLSNNSSLKELGFYRQSSLLILMTSFVTVGFSLVSEAVSNKALDKEYEKYRMAFHHLLHKDEKKIPVAGERKGKIVDRFGKPLAKSVRVYNVWSNPEGFDFENNKLVALSALLDTNLKETVDRIHKFNSQGKKFVYLKKGVDSDIVQAVKNLGISGVYFNPVEERHYPFGESVAHVVGISDMDGKGLEGAERFFSQQLFDGKEGRDVQLSIDQRIQQTVFATLRDTASAHSIEKGAAIVVDTRNGEVLALASYPSYNPNNRKNLLIQNTFNRAISSRVEPGMAISPFTLMGAMNDRDFRDSVTAVDTAPGYLKIGKNVIKDPANYGRLTFPELLEKRSKVGLSQVASNVPRKTLWLTLDSLGLGMTHNIELPGQVAGYLPHWSDWSDVGTATLSYGYGLSVTPLHLAQAYLAIANDGEMPAVTLTKNQRSKGVGSALTTPAIAREIRFYMERKPVSVSKNGVNTDLRIAGQGALVQKVGPTGYEENYTGLFVGMAPIEDPRYLVVVMLDNAPTDQSRSLAILAEAAFADVVAAVEQLDWQ
ncbi:FtsW/RodA/SpoVE family cell cycle protein [bacterium SCSIO 12696]|nr:FtsW/RodA/SpoVE family cell cycle protein [bacterium SCSIO 12696]